MSSQRRLLAVERRCGLFPKKVRPGDSERLAALEQLLTDPAFAAAKAEYAAGLVIGDDDESRIRAWHEIRSRSGVLSDEWRLRHLYCDTSDFVPCDLAPPDAPLAAVEQALAFARALRACDCRADAPPAIPDDRTAAEIAADARVFATARAEMAAYRATLGERG